MKTITTNELDTVTGGATKTDSAVTQQLTSLQSSIKDLAANNNSNKSNDLLPLVMMAAMNRPSSGPTVVATGAPAAPAASGPVVNISNRVRHW